MINDIRFKSRRTIDWKEIENYLKEYICQYYEISETAEKIYIGTDYPDYGNKHKSKQSTDGIDMTQDSVFRYMTIQSIWSDIIFFLQEC